MKQAALVVALLFVTVTSECTKAENAAAIALHAQDTKEGASKNPGFRWKIGGKDDEPWPSLKFDARTASAVALGAIGAALCSAGGVGGGGLYVPIFNLLLDFNTRTAAVMSNFMIFGGMIANLIWSSFQRNPTERNRPLVDYDAALLMQPNMLLGISIGVFCNIMFPGWLITLLLTVTLGIVTFRSCRCGFRLWKEESYLANLPPADQIVEGCTDDEIKSEKDVNGNVEEPLLSVKVVNDGECLPSSTAVPMNKVLALVMVWLSFCAVQIIRGSRTSTSGGSAVALKACGVGYWLVTASQIPLAVLITVWTLSKMHSPTEKLEGKWDVSQARLILPLMALSAGVLGGLLGIGGGMIMNPILLEIGMPPQVTAATTAFMVFFSSSQSAIQYWLVGRIPVEYAVCFASLCFVFSLIGLKVVQRSVRKYGRASIIVFIVSSVMGLSAVLMGLFGGLDVFRQFRDGYYMGFHSPCS